MLYFLAAIIAVAGGIWWWLWELQRDTGLTREEWRAIDKETFRPGFPGMSD